jgi:hypothetical protein
MPRARKLAPGWLYVQRRPCATCIYRPETPFDTERLEAPIVDPRMPGFFTSYRACHHAPRHLGVCCHGFWRLHRWAFTLGQLAQRLKRVRFVDIDHDPRRRKGDQTR